MKRVVIVGNGPAAHRLVERLRAALGAPELVQTVIKRGYRLPLEPVRDAPRCVRS